GSLGLDLGVYGAPETYLIDAKGIIQYRHIGAINAEDAQKLIQLLQNQAR
ncbi:MAG: putative thiol:disulfide interchange protein DsbE, partial [Pseudomonadota bacterium]